MRSTLKRVLIIFALSHRVLADLLLLVTPVGDIGGDDIVKERKEGRNASFVREKF